MSANMRNLWTSVGAFGILAALGACSATQMSDAYPTHFTDTADKTAAVRVIENKFEVPSELLAAMPPYFQLARHVGMLSVILDGDGYVYTGLSKHDRFQFAIKSEAYKSALSKYPRSRYELAALPGYSHATIIHPKLDLLQAMELEVAQDWLRFFHRYYAEISNRDKLRAMVEKLQSQIDDAQRTGAHLDQEITTTRADIATMKQRIAQLIQDIAAIQFPIVENAQIPLQPLRIRYSFEDDMFRTIYQRRLLDIRGQFGLVGVDNPYLHSEMVEALNRANAMMRNPRAHFVPHIAELIEAAQLSPLQLASASRSILHQAVLKSATRAGYLDSRHAFGVAVDLNFMRTNYNVRTTNPSAEATQNYNLLMIVLQQAGLVRSIGYQTRAERNHITLSKYARLTDGHFNENFDKDAFVTLALSFLADFERAADAAFTSLLVSIRTLNQQEEWLLSRYLLMSAEIEEKQKLLESLRQQLQKTKEKAAARERDKQKKLEKKARREAEIRRRREAELARERERERHAERLVRLEHERERRIAEREHRERMQREEGQMREWMRELEARDRERQRRDPPEREWRIM